MPKSLLNSAFTHTQINNTPVGSYEVGIKQFHREF